MHWRNKHNLKHECLQNMCHTKIILKNIGVKQGLLSQCHTRTSQQALGCWG